MTSESYIKVSAVMARTVRIIDPLATIREALREMSEFRISSLVIERRDPADELGIIMIGDIAAHVIASNLSPDRVNVYEVMSKPVITLDQDMHIKYAIRLLHRFSLSRGLVTDHERQLVGLATLRDMVLRYAQEDAGPK